MPDSFAMTKLQFRVLYRVFLLRIVDLELLPAHGDTVRLLGQFAALFAAVSFMFTAPVILIGGGLSPEALWTMEHLLIATTMLVSGLFAVLSWDSIFPERQDLLILAPLPVRARTLFLAKLAAALAALSLAVVALNIFSGVIWPLVFFSAGPGVLHAIRSLAAYWVTVLGAAVFVFCSVLSVQSLAAQILPRQFFLRLSAVLQVIIVCLFVSVYLLEPSLESLAALGSPENQRALSWLPSYWFLGMFQQLNGSMHSEFAPLAVRAQLGLTIAVVGVGIGALLSYLLTIKRIVEEPDILPSQRRMRWSLRFSNSLQSAIVLFSARTLLRSRQHRVILSFYLGVGFAVVLAYLKGQPSQGALVPTAAITQMGVPWLAASILLMCITVTGVRVVFSMPITLRANWIFRITEIHTAESYLAAIRRTLILLTCAPVLVLFALLFFYLYPLKPALGHLVLLGLLGVILVELCLAGFSKLPFTCSYLPGKGNIQFAFWAFVLLLPLSYAAAQAEVRLLQSPKGYTLIVVLLCIVALAARRRSLALSKLAEGLTFDEAPSADLLALGLRTDGELLVESAR